MKALLPVFCRPLGYGIMALALFMPFVMAALGKVTNDNLLFYKECAKLLMMIGALMILFAYHRQENEATLKARNSAVSTAMFITVLYVFGGMLYRVGIGDIRSVDGSSFLVFLIINVLCQEFLIKKALVDRLFKQK